MIDIERTVTDGGRALATLLTELYDSADAWAIGRLLERRPELDRPPEPRIPVPPEEALRVSLDRLAYVAWLQQGLALACDPHVAVALRAGATWPQVAEALRCHTDEARERYDHLALLAGGGAPAGGRRAEGGDGR
jgi:hypothetical protein